MLQNLSIFLSIDLYWQKLTAKVNVDIDFPYDPAVPYLFGSVWGIKIGGLPSGNLT